MGELAKEAVCAEVARDVPANWQEFVKGVLSALRDAKREANRKGPRKHYDELDALYQRLDSANAVANIHGARGPRAGYWVEQAYQRACAVKRLLDAEHGTVSAD